MCVPVCVVFPLADFVIDVHSGDGAEWLAPFVGVYGGPLASEYELALNVRYLVQYNGAGPGVSMVAGEFNSGCRDAALFFAALSMRN